jgi:ABC-type transport system involved in multi-copper enzyme maturation permease subunit
MDDASLFSGVIVLLFAIMSVTSFAYDKQFGWDTYVLSIPVSRKEVVLSKYVLSVLLAIFGGVLALLVGWLHGIFHHISNFSEVLIVSYALFAVSLIFLSVLLPLVYKFGVERSRVIILAVFAIPTAAFLLLAQTGTVVAPDEQTIRQVLLFSPVVVIVCGVLSFMISHAIYRRKEV